MYKSQLQVKFEGSSGVRKRFHRLCVLAVHVGVCWTICLRCEIFEMSL